MIRRLFRAILRAQDRFEDSLDVWPDDEPIPFALGEDASPIPYELVTEWAA